MGWILEFLFGISRAMRYIKNKIDAVSSRSEVAMTKPLKQHIRGAL
jgi:hypothetical protein